MSAPRNVGPPKFSRPRPWMCDPKTPVCVNNHPYVHVRESASQQSIEFVGFAHLYFTCRRCDTHAFGLLTELPFPALTMYACSAEELQHIRAEMRMANSLDILDYLTYDVRRKPSAPGAAA